MRRKIIVPLLLLMLLIAAIDDHGLYLYASAFGNFFDSLDTGEISRDELLAQQYYTMVDENGREIMVTGRKIHVGDEYLTSDNKLYRVERVQKYVAKARFVREVGAVFAPKAEGFFAFWQQLFSGSVQAVQKNQDKEEKKDDSKPQPQPKRLIGVYHTHNAESYVPTDGTDSINGKGGIHQVGDSFTEALKEKDIKVIHSNTLHLPHDRGAYRRSRVTAEKILDQNPDVIFDVHRDAGPPEAYATTVNKQTVTQVQFVVGRQNPQMQTIRQFALDMKNTADKIHPNLVKGIFMARGNYNQDLTATSMLIEVGTHLNDREKAQDGAALFADVVSYYFYGPEDENNEQAAPAPRRTPANGGSEGKVSGNMTRAAVRNALWMLVLTLVIAVAFFFINTPLAGIRERLAPFFSQALPYTEKGDIFLDAVQKRIRAAALFTVEQSVNFLQSGDDFLAPIAETIRTIFELIITKTETFVQSGDRYAAYWQERIENYFLTLREKSRRLRERDKLK